MSAASRWRGMAPGIGIALLSLCAMIVASRATGPSFAELERLALIDALEPVVKRVATQGPAALTDVEALRAYAVGGGHGLLPALLAAWSKLSLGRIGLLDPLTAARLPWLLVIAMAPLGVASLARGLGRGGAALAATLLLVTPGFVHAAAVTREDALLAAIWTLALALERRAARARTHRLLPQLGAASVVALGATYDLGALWVVPGLALLSIVDAPSRAWRAAARGRLPLSATVPVALVLALLAVVASHPSLWRSSAIGIAGHFFAAVAPSIRAAPLAGELVQAAPGPLTGPLLLVLSATPLAVLVLASLGAVLAWPRATKGASAAAEGTSAAAQGTSAAADGTGAAADGTGAAADGTGAAADGTGAAHETPFPPHATTRASSARPAARGVRSVALLVLILCCCVAPLAPLPLAVFPPRAAIALPFVALLAARGAVVLVAIARLPPRVERLVPSLLVAALAVSTWLHIETASAHVSLAVGGAARAARLGTVPVRDGSELALLARNFDAEGATPRSLTASGVPPDYFTRLVELERARTAAVIAPQGAAQLAAGEGSGDVIARVARDGATLWSLSR